MRLLLAIALAALPLTGCGEDGDASGSGPLTVSAAASLKTAFEDYGRSLEGARPRFSFAGSDELAAQIEQGVRPDVYAAANTALPQRLFEQGLVEQPVVFAGNELVLAVPAEGAKVAALADLRREGVTVAVGQEDVPVGAYTRAVLDRLPEAEAAGILANVRTEEPDVAGITGKLTQGAVDAGFLYASDVRAAGGVLAAIELPARLRPTVAYGAAVVKGAENPAGARAFVDGLLDGAGRRALAEAGFLPPP